MNNIQKIVDQLNAISIRPLENPELIYRYISDSLSKKTKITFYNWECPPRYLDKNKNGETFLNYCVDLSSLAKGKKVDAYTEIPRVIEKAKEEKNIIKLLKSLNLNFRFVKIIADTNAFYITPESIAYVGKKKIMKAHKDFKQLIINKAKQYPIPVQVRLFTELIRPVQTSYNKYFKKVLSSLNINDNQFISPSIYKAQLSRTRSHIGLKDNQYIELFAKKTIATYSAEGMVLAELSKTKSFSNCIWLNIEEANKRTIDITNIIRKQKNIGNLPMFFPS